MTTGYGGPPGDSARFATPAPGSARFFRPRSVTTGLGRSLCEPTTQLGGPFPTTAHTDDETRGEGSLVKRRLTIRTKLAATLAVPLAALASFAALQVRDAYNQSAQVKLQAGLATSATGPAGVLTALETERDYESLRAINAQDLVAPKNTKFSAQVTASTDVALGNFRLLLGDVGGDAAGNYQATLTQVSTRLVQLRQQAEDDASKVVSPANAKNASAIFDRYTTMIGSLLDADQRSSSTINDAELRSGAELLNAIARQSDDGVRGGYQGRPRRDHRATRLRCWTRSVSPTGRPKATPTSTCARTARSNVPSLGALDAPAREKAVAELQAAARDPLHVNLQALLGIRPDVDQLAAGRADEHRPRSSPNRRTT